LAAFHSKLGSRGIDMENMPYRPMAQVPHPMPRPPSSVGGPTRRAEWLTPPRMALGLPRYGSLFANISPTMTAH
jgi:hypothetical protein